MNEIMSQTLYRKYRPQNFEEILGQEEIVKSLKNSIKNKQVTHAYLFSGPRGCGKTSTARIFSKELKIDNADIYEIDAASNRGIEQVKELRKNAYSLPVNSEYKIFIIDEVHMMTKEAFNALLKILEEPPKHVIFILATTEKEKIPETIISRCQKFNFKKAERKDIFKIIEKIAQEEKIKISKEAINEIIENANGSFRDALTEFQKIISIYGKNIEKIKSENYEKLIFNFIEKINEKEKLKKIYIEILEKNYDLNIFLEKVLEKMREIILIKNSPEMKKYFENKYDQNELDKLSEIKINSSNLKEILEIIYQGQNYGKIEIFFEIFLNE